METNNKLHSVALASATLILFLILVSSTASSDPIKNASPMEKHFAYITNAGTLQFPCNTVSVIDTATNAVIAIVTVGRGPSGVTVTHDGTKVYVANNNNDTVSVIDTVINEVTATVPVGNYPRGIAVNSVGTKVYVTNFGSNNVSVIDTATNTVIATVKVGSNPYGVAVNPKGTKIYVANGGNNTVSIIDTATNNVTSIVPVGNFPGGVAVNTAGTKVYVTNRNGSTTSIIDTATNTVTATVHVGNYPVGVAVTPDGKKAYVANEYSNNISVIDTATNTVTATVPVGNYPIGVAITSDGKKVYVANFGNPGVLPSSSVSVIDTTTNTVTASVTVEPGATAFGQFVIGSPPTEVVLNGTRVPESRSNQLEYLKSLSKNYTLSVLFDITLKNIISIITAFISLLGLNNLTLREKNQYIKLLKVHFSHIEAFLNTINRYKTIIRILPIIILPMSIYLGFYIEFYLAIGILLIVSSMLTMLESSIFSSVLANFLNNVFGALNICICSFNFYMLLLSIILNISIVIIILIYFFWCKLIKSKRILPQTFKKFCGFRDPLTLVYISFWTILGMIFGAYIGVCNIIHSFLQYFSFITDGDFSVYNIFSVCSYFSDIYTGMVVNKQILHYYVILYFSVMLLSLYCIVDLYKKIKLFFSIFPKLMINYYERNFPYVKIITESGEIKGQIRDIQNKSFLTLIEEKDTFNFLHWDKIERMEVSNTDKKEYTIFDKGTLSDK